MPVAQNPVYADARYSSYGNREADSHLNGLSKRIDWLKAQFSTRKMLHIIDREADSAAHLRQWDENGHTFLVRVKEGNKLNYNGQSLEIIAQAKDWEIEEGTYHGQKAQIRTTQMQVTLTRPAKPKKKQANGSVRRRCKVKRLS